MSYTIEELMQNRAVEGTPIMPRQEDIVPTPKPETAQYIKPQVVTTTKKRTRTNKNEKTEFNLVRRAKEYALTALMIIGVISVAALAIRLLIWLFGI